MAIRRTTKSAVKKTKRTTAKRTIKKKTSAKKGTKRAVAFGGYTINFNGCADSLQNVFGNKPLAPSEMTKKLWAYVKKNNLNG